MRGFSDNPIMVNPAANYRPTHRFTISLNSGVFGYVQSGGARPISEVVFIDPLLKEAATIESQLPEGVEAARPAPGVDGVTQISARLTENNDNQVYVEYFVTNTDGATGENATEGSLAWAVGSANANTGAVKISFAPSTNGKDIVLDHTLKITGHLIISGNGAAKTVITSPDRGGVFSADGSQATVTVDSVSMKGGTSVGIFKIS
jgi:hypothetical protein